MDSLIKELKQLLIESLQLEDVTEQDIKNDTVLFGEGLGLDSIDALELGIALKKKYGIKVDANTDGIGEHFLTISTLASFVENHMA